MKYADAAALGVECGLNQPAEYVNNVRMHVLNLFPYSEIRGQLRELAIDALEHGVRFSVVCGDAVLAGESEDEVCYICRKISEVNG